MDSIGGISYYLNNVSFSCTGDMISEVKISNVPYDPDHAPFRGGLLFIS